LLKIDCPELRCPECGSTYLHCTASVTVSYRFYPSPSANVAYGEPLGSPEVAEDSPVTCRRCSHQGERRTFDVPGALGAACLDQDTEIPSR